MFLWLLNYDEFGRVDEPPQNRYQDRWNRNAAVAVLVVGAIAIMAIAAAIIATEM